MIKNVIRRISKVLKPKSKAPLFSKKLLLRVLYFNRLLKMIKDVPGTVVECGVGQGFDFCIWESLIFLEKQDRRLWGFDSFDGFPKVDEKDEISEKNEKVLNDEYKKFTLRYVHNMFLDFGLTPVEIDRMTFIKGFIPESLTHYNGQPIALLYLDLDIYHSYKSALEGLWDNVAIGGVVAFDEYDKPLDHVKYPGARKAIDEFLREKNLSNKLIKDYGSGNVYLIKS